MDTRKVFQLKILKLEGWTDEEFWKLTDAIKEIVLDMDLEEDEAEFLLNDDYNEEDGIL